MSNLVFFKNKEKEAQKKAEQAEQKKRELDFEKSVRDAVETTYKKSLQEIMRLEYKKTGPSGQEVVDYEMTVRMVRNQAAIALNFASNVSSNMVKKDEVL